MNHRLQIVELSPVTVYLDQLSTTSFHYYFRISTGIPHLVTFIPFLLASWLRLHVLLLLTLIRVLYGAFSGGFGPRQG